MLLREVARLASVVLRRNESKKGYEDECDE